MDFFTFAGGLSVTNKKALIFAVFLLILSLWLTAAVSVTILSGGNSTSAGFGGYFLFNTFYHTAFYVPLYLLLCVFFLLRKNFNKNDIIVLILTLVPFFTSGIALRIYLGAGNTSLEKFIEASFGPLSPLLLLLLIVIECILIIHAAVFLKKNPVPAEKYVSGNEKTASVESKEPALKSGAAQELFSDEKTDTFHGKISESRNLEESVIKDIENTDGFSSEKNGIQEAESSQTENYNFNKEDQLQDSGMPVHFPSGLDSYAENSETAEVTDIIPKDSQPVPEREQYKPISLSSVFSLKGRRKKAVETSVSDENADSSNSLQTFRDEDSEEEYSGNRGYNPADYGIVMPQKLSAGNSEEQDSTSTDSLEDNNHYEIDDEIKAESSVEGVDYSEPAYFRQQNISSELEDDFYEENREAENSSDFSDGRVSFHDDEVAPATVSDEEKDEYNTDKMDSYDRDFSGYERSEDKDAYSDGNSLNNHDNSDPYDEVIAEYYDDENQERGASDTDGYSSYKEDDEEFISISDDNKVDDFSESTDTETASAYIRENDSYDPLTQYNTEIDAEETDINTSASEKDLENPESRSGISGSYQQPSGAFSEDENLQADEDDDFEEEEDEGQVDNTAIVKQYFESARFIKPPKKPGKYEIPVENVLDFYQEESYDRIDARAREEADVLKQTLAEFKIEAEVTGIRKGPVITMFEILPAPGVKLSRITNLADNIALRLAASRVRIVAPIPGKHAVGIEVPNRKRAIVSFRELIEVNYNQYEKDNLPVVLGKDITGEEQIVDLTKTPHLLIAGATGSGKSVCVNSIITSLLYKRAPRDVKMILIDPKIVELKLYNGIPHLLTPVITDPKKAYQALQYCVFEMERRYSLLDALSCRDIQSFNRKIKSEKIATMPLPYIMVVVDEFADLMATTGKELESTLARLAAMSRAVGIHLVLATQRPSIDVITGLIKANIPSRIAFMVASKTDSRIIIDSMGAEMLLGKGDMLFTSAWNPYPVRIQGAYLSESEVEKVVEQVKEYGEPEYIDDEIFIDDDEDDYTSFEEENINDPLMNRALEIVTTAGKASASYLQRRLKIGYNRAARLVEEMERKGIVGPQNGSKPRDLLHIPDDFRE